MWVVVWGFVCGLLLGVVFGVCVCSGLGTTFGLSQHVGDRRLCLGVFVWDLELPRGMSARTRGMSATTLPGGKCPYGICQNREEWGVRECLLVEVWII